MVMNCIIATPGYVWICLKMPSTKWLGLFTISTIKENVVRVCILYMLRFINCLRSYAIAYFVIPYQYSSYWNHTLGLIMHIHAFYNYEYDV
jgi:hypothetical protein